MGCTVTKVILENGASSILFKELQNSMSDSLALETYLELTSNKSKYEKMYGVNSQGEIDGSKYTSTPKYKLPNFDTFRQQEDVMEMLSQRFLAHLKTNPKTRSSSTLSGINLNGISEDRTIVSSIIANIKKEIIDTVDANSDSISERGAELLLDAADKLESYIFNVVEYTDVNEKKQRKTLLGPVGRILVDYGINLTISERPADIEKIENDINEEDIDEVDIDLRATQEARIYDLAITETNPSNSVLDQLKVYLHSIKKVNPKWKYSEKSPTPDYELSEVYQERLEDFDVIYAKLVGALKNIQSVDEVYSKIKSAMKVDTQLVPIYNHLINEQSNIDSSSYRPLATALYTLTLADYNMFTIVEKEDNQVVIMDSNSSSSAKKVSQMWEYDISMIKKGSTAHILKKIKTLLSNENSVNTQKYINRKVEIKTKAGTVSVYEPAKSYLKPFADVFQEAGFSGVTVNVLEEVIQKGLKDKTLITNELTELTPYRIIQTLVRTLPEKAMTSNQNIFSSEWRKGEGKTIKLLSEVVGQNSVDISGNAFLSDKGKLVYPLNKASAAQDTFTLLSSDSSKGQQYLKEFLNDPMYTNSKLMQIFTKADGGASLANFKFRSLHTLSNKNKAKAVDYSEMSTFDSLIARMNSFFSPAAKPIYFQAFTPTQADRGNLTTMTVPKFNIKEGINGTVAGNVYSKNKIIAEDVKEWLKNQIESEIYRAIDYKDHPKIKGYESRALSFVLFPELNDIVDLKTIRENQVDSTVERLLPFAEQAFINAIESDIKYYIKNKVISKDQLSNNFKPNKQYKKNFSSTTLKKDLINRADMENFLANNLIYNYEALLYISGDPAFYGDSIKLNKRLALPYTPGSKLAVGDGTGMPDTFTVKILKEPTVHSELAELYDEITGKKGSFNNIDLADGWGIGSMTRFRQLNLSRGTHDDNLLLSIDKEIQGKEGDAILGSKKMFYFKIQSLPSGLMAPLSLKYSLFPAIPSLFEAKLPSGEYKYPALAEISKELNSGLTDELVMESAFKTGGHDIVNLNNLGETDGIILDNDFVREVQVVPNKQSTEYLLGSQIRKLIISNYEKDGHITLNGQKIPAQEALQVYNKALASLAILNSEEVDEIFLPNGKVDLPTLSRELVNASTNSTHQNVDYISSALSTFLENGNSVLPINYPTHGFKLDATINAAYKKAVNRMKLPGHTAVQIPSFGTMFTKKDKQLEVGSDLKFVRFADSKGVEIKGQEALDLAKKVQKFTITRDPELLKELNNYKTLPAEVRVTPAFFLKKLEEIARKKTSKNPDLSKEALAFADKYGKGEANKKALYKSKRRSLFKEYNELEFKKLKSLIYKNGAYDIKALAKYGLDEIVLYRIPTQGKNSMLLAKIVDFLPVSSGNTIQVPAEIVKQAGSDFDIDKVFMEMQDFDVHKDGMSLEKIQYSLEEDTPNIANKEAILPVIQQIIKAKDFIKLSDDGKTYINIKTKQEYTRVTSYIKDTTSTTNAKLTSSQIIGTKVDILVRDFFNNTLKPLTEYSVTSDLKELKAFIKALEDIKNKMDLRGEVVLAQDIILHNNKLGIAGTVDLLTYDNKGEVRIYDMKTMLGDNFNESYNGQKESKYDTTTYGESKRTQHQKQLSLYKILLNNTYGIKAKELAVIPIQINYKAGDTSTDVLKILKLLKVPGLTQVNDATLVDEKNKALFTKSQAQAAVFDFHRGVLSSLAHTGELLLPNGTERLAEVIKSLNLSEASQVGNVASVELQETFRINNQAGKNLISISSVASVMHAVAQHISPYFKTPVFISGEELTLGRTLNISGTELISTEIAEIQNAAVDNAKEPLLGLLNINQFTASTALLLVSAGHGLKFASAVLNAPIIKELSDAYQKHSRLNNSTNAYNLAYKEVSRKIPVEAGKKGFSSDTFTEDMAVSLIGLNRELTPLDHAISLAAFDKFRELGEQLSKFQRTMNIDSKGTPSSTSKLFSVINDLADIEGTNSYTLKKSGDKNLNIFKVEEKESKTNKIAVDEEKYKNFHISVMEDKAILSALKTNIKVSPTASKQFQNVLEVAKDKLGYISDNNQIGLLSAYNTYLAVNSKSNTIKTSSISKDISKGKYNYLTQTVHPESTASLLKAYREAVKNNELPPNRFIQQLNIIEKDGRSFVTFLNSTSKAVSGKTKSRMMHYYEDLIEGSNLEKRLAQSLADYALVHYGFSTSINSFMDFIPPIAHRTYMGNGITLPEVFESLQGNYNDTEKFTDPDKFIDLYIANNFNKLNIAGYKDYEEFLVEYDRLVENKLTTPKYIKMYNSISKSYTLYSVNSSGIPTEIATKGIPNLAYEYHDGPSMFNHDVSHGTILGKAEQANDSVTNQKIVDNILNEDPFTAVVGSSLDIDKQTFNTRKDINDFVSKLEDKLKKDSRVTENEAETTIGIIKTLASSSDRMFKTLNNNNSSQTLDLIFKERFKEGNQEFLTLNYAEIIKRNMC